MSKNYDGKKFVTVNLKRLSLIEPGSVDLFFMAESITELKRQIASLMGLKGQMADLNDAIKRFAFVSASSGTAAGGASKLAFAPDRTHNFKMTPSIPGAGMALKSGMVNDVNLKVDLNGKDDKRAAERKDTFADRVKTANKPPVFGTSKAENSSLKASVQPREFHLYIGNLGVDTEAEFI